MSYDLAVFDPRPELRVREDFVAWFEERTDWEQGYDYNDSAHAAEALRNWFMEIIETFPPMSGPLAYCGEDEGVLATTAGYSIAPDIIYITFSWSQATEAYNTCVSLAAKHAIGFYNVSGHGEVYFPDGRGELVQVLRAGSE